MPIGWLISLLILAPNLLWMRFPPVEVPPPSASPKSWPTKVLEVVENIGRLGVFVISFLHHIELSGAAEKFSAALMLAALAVYYLGWLRYFRQGRLYALLFRPWLGLPVPLAISPAVYFAAASVVLHSVLLAATAALFGIAHITLSWQEARRIGAQAQGFR
jgi:hypothetical protein